MMGSRWRRSYSLLALLLLASPIFAQNDFSFYPPNAQPCLNDASDRSGCNGATVPEMNKCLCGNGGNFVTNTASCIGRTVQDDLETAQKVFGILSDACRVSSTPLTVKESDFLAAARQATTQTTRTTTRASTTSPTATETGRVTVTVTSITDGKTQTITYTTSMPTATGPPAGGQQAGLTDAAKIGIGVGGGVALVALAGGILLVWRQRRSRAVHGEAQPMLGGFGDPGAAGAYPGGQDWKNDNKPASWRPVSGITSSGSPAPWRTPSPQAWDGSQHAWGHHPQAAYNPQGPGLYPPQPDQPAVYELASMPASHPPEPLNNPVEMPANAIEPRGPQYPSQYTGYGR